ERRGFDRAVQRAAAACPMGGACQRHWRRLPGDFWEHCDELELVRGEHAGCRTALVWLYGIGTYVAVGVRGDTGRADPCRDLRPRAALRRGAGSGYRAGTCLPGEFAEDRRYLAAGADPADVRGCCDLGVCPVSTGRLRGVPADGAVRRRYGLV